MNKKKEAAEMRRSAAKRREEGLLEIALLCEADAAQLEGGDPNEVFEEALRYLPADLVKSAKNYFSTLPREE